jgi:outer membrane protein assembly factor BamB
MLRTARLACRTSLVLACFVAATLPAVAGNWPRFRGPNGTGVAADKDVPVEWNETSGIKWKTEIPGLGHSSPIVWGDRLFLQSASADGTQRLLLCLNTADGKIVWSRTVPGSTATKHPKNSLASSTPATDGERVYALFWDGKDVTLYAYDFKGELVWHRDLGSFTSQHGAGTSPMIYEDKVILANDQDGKAELLALDSKTGKPVWQIERKAFRTCYATPFLLEKGDGTPELIVASTAGVSSYNPKDGGENWTWANFNPRCRCVASPIGGDGLVIANTGNGEGDRQAVAVKVGGKGDVTKTNLAWETKEMPYVPTLLLSGGYLYGVRDKADKTVKDRKLAACFEAKTGKVVWSEEIGGTFSSSPVLINGNVYAASEEGDVYVFAAAPTFKLLARNNLGERVMATPAVADNRLYYRCETHLICIGK